VAPPSLPLLVEDEVDGQGGQRREPAGAAAGADHWQSTVALPRRRSHALQLASAAAANVLSSLAAALEVVIRSRWRDDVVDAAHDTVGGTSAMAPAA
jgi:hypothetical protein